MSADERPELLFTGESTSSQVRRFNAELDSALRRLSDREREVQLAMSELASARQENQQLRERVVELTGRLAFRPRLPVTDDEVRQWFADRGLALGCGPAVVFAALRKDFNQTTEGDEA